MYFPQPSSPQVRNLLTVLYLLYFKQNFARKLTLDWFGDLNNNQFLLYKFFCSSERVVVWQRQPPSRMAPDCVEVQYQFYPLGYNFWVPVLYSGIRYTTSIDNEHSAIMRIISKYPTMHNSGMPSNSQLMIVCNVLSAYFWEIPVRLALWGCW